MTVNKSLLRLGRIWIFKVYFVPPDLLRMLSFVLREEKWHSVVFAILTSCSRCVETTSWVHWFPLFICASSFLLSCLEPYLSTNASLWPPGYSLFSSFCFLMEMTVTQNLLFPSAGLFIADKALPEGRRISRQNQTAPANVDLTLCGRGTLHLMSHEVKNPPFPLGCDRGWGKHFITVSYT